MKGLHSGDNVGTMRGMVNNVMRVHHGTMDMMVVMSVVCVAMDVSMAMVVMLHHSSHSKLGTTLPKAKKKSKIGGWMMCGWCYF